MVMIKTYRELHIVNKIFNSCTSRIFWPCWSICMVLIISMCICGAVKYHVQVSHVTLFFYVSMGVTLVGIELLWYSWAAFVHQHSRMVLQSLKLVAFNDKASRGQLYAKELRVCCRSLQTFGVNISYYCILNTQAVLGFLLIGCNVAVNALLLLWSNNKKQSGRNLLYGSLRFKNINAPLQFLLIGCNVTVNTIILIR